MKRMIACVVAVATFLVSSVCFAESLPVSEVALGGIPFHASPEYVESVYGEPSEAEPYGPGMWENATKWKYGDSVGIIFENDELVALWTNANNGFSTPAGAHVGMKVSELRKLYGTPMNESKNMCYYRSEADRHLGIRFKYTNGVVTSIDIGLFDG